MCDYSLHDVKTRPARVGDRLKVRNFGTGTRGFSASEKADVAVCLLPGTELSFDGYVRRARTWPWSKDIIEHRTAIFRQINKEISGAHHEAVEFPDGQIMLLTLLKGGQRATVLQLPVTIRKAVDEKATPGTASGVSIAPR